ncbi:MAG: hypothetical protein Q8J97_03815, partial [Flavobacteriaceae bacterium]|nr:hypothetical protein [Flavobacteriaceae bacterium]
MDIVGSFDRLVTCHVASSENRDGIASHLAGIMPFDGRSVRPSEAPRDGSVNILLMPNSDFYIQYNERIECIFSRRMFRDKIFDANLSIQITAPTSRLAASDATVTAARIIAYPAALLAASVTFKGTAALSVARVDALLGIEACTFQLGEALSPAYHPMQFPIGSGRTRYFAGAGIMNFVLVASLAAVMLFVAQLRLERNRAQIVGIRRSLAQLRFPAAPIVLALFFLQRTLESNFVVALHSGEAELRGVCITMIVVWILVWLAALAHIFRRFGAIFTALAPPARRIAEGKPASASR